MFPRVTRVRHLGEYRLQLTFTDHTKGTLDLSERIVGRGGVFKPLQDVGFFKRVRVDPEAGTIVWPNDVDFCPDVLYSWVTGKPIKVRRTIPESRTSRAKTPVKRHALPSGSRN